MAKRKYYPRCLTCKTPQPPDSDWMPYCTDACANKDKAKRINAMVRSLNEAIGELRVSSDGYMRAENIIFDTLEALRELRMDLTV